MAVVILYHKDNNTIHLFEENAVSVQSNRVDVVGGYLEGWNPEGIGVLVTRDLSYSLEEKPQERTIILNDETTDIVVDKTYSPYLKDVHGNEYKSGDILPSNLTNITSQFIKQSDTEVLQQRIADLELMLVEILSL